MANDEVALVTGAAGFIGANLVRLLLARGQHVVALLRQETDAWRLPQEHPTQRLRVLRVSLGGRASDRQLAEIGSVARVYHLAAAAVNQSVSDVPAMIAGNVVATYAALDLASRLEAKRFVFVGSSGEYGPCELAREGDLPAPNSEYGATKLAGSNLAHAYGRRTGLPVVAVRPFSVFGPFEAGYRLVPYCMVRALDRLAIDTTDGLQTRDYIFVDDVVEGIAAAASTPGICGGTFNLCSGRSTQVRDMVEAIVQLCGSNVRPNFGARAAPATEMWRTSGDPALARQMLGWSPRYSIGDGLRATRDWLIANRARHASRYS